jgi:hypothetical protein
VSRPNVTDKIVVGLSFARACVLDQRASSHKRRDHQWDDDYKIALDAIDEIVRAHAKSKKAKGA